MQKKIEIAKDFSPYPSGRFRRQGKHSGEEFRDDYLAPALREHDHVEVILDGALGYGSSFLEEAFGGLIRVAKFTKLELDQKLSIIAIGRRYEVYRNMALEYIRNAATTKS